MVEVLVSVLVLAIGLLGVAAMQATALRNSQSSYERSQGVVHVYTIFDAMRANPQVARTNGYNMPMTCGAIATGSLASDDRNQWLQTLRNNLSQSACGQINCLANVCTVTVQWDDSRGSGGAETGTVVAHQFSTTTRI